MEVAFEEDLDETVANGFLAEESVINDLSVKSAVNQMTNGVFAVKDTSNGQSLSDSSVIETDSSEEQDLHKWYTLTRDEVPLLFRESYVEGGFRPLNKPWLFYLRSNFYLHNECMNVWTHVIATVLTSWQLWVFNKELDFINDPYTWPMLAGLLCGIALYGCSTFAHCCQSRSEFVHYVAFMVDYAGIGLYGLGSVIVHLMYCCEEEFYDAVHVFFIPLGGVLAFLISCCHSIAKVRYSRPYPFVRKLWQMIPVLSIYIVLISPIAHRLYACYGHGVDCTESISYHNQQIFWFFTSGFFFASDIPQRFLHGKCDIFGHSHQLFHIAIALSTLYQMEAVYLDFETRSEIIRSRAAPTFLNAFGPVLIVVCLEIACIIYFSTRVAKKLQADEMKSK